MYDLDLKVDKYFRDREGIIYQIAEILNNTVFARRICDSEYEIVYISNISTEVQPSYNLLELLKEGDLLILKNGEGVVINNVNLGNGEYVFCGVKRVYLHQIKSLVPIETIARYKQNIDEEKMKE